MSSFSVKVHSPGRETHTMGPFGSEGSMKKRIATYIRDTGLGTWQEAQKFARRMPRPGVKGFKPGTIFQVTIEEGGE